VINMAKKELRKAREAEERRVSGVPQKTPPPSGVTTAGPTSKDAKRALRATRPAKAAGEGGGEPAAG
jgi:hypothetical protein